MCVTMNPHRRIYNKKTFMTGVRLTIPIYPGIVLAGISFGLLTMQAGFSAFQTVLIFPSILSVDAARPIIGLVGGTGAAFLAWKKRPLIV